MPSPALILWADSSRNAFAAGWQSNLDASDIVLRQGDSIGIELHWVRRTSTLSAIMDEMEWPVSANITLAVGKLDLAPTAGNFTLTYGSQTTTSLPFGCTAVQMENALNALSSIASDGGVVVAKTNTSYRIAWNNVGVASSTLTVGQNNLTPTTSIGIATARTGSVSVANLVQIHIKQAPVAVQTTWVDQDAPDIVVTQVHAPAYSGDYRIWRFKISPEPKGGSFRLSKTINGVTTWTAPIYTTNSASDITEMLGITCTQVGPSEYELVQPQVTGASTTNITSIGSDASGLVAYQAKYGVLNLNTLDLELLLAGASSTTALLEIEVEISGTRETIVQKQVTILNDLIDTDSYTLTTWGELIPADSVVRYDTSQALTTPQKTQARTNIGALGSSDLSAFTTKDNELEGRLGTLETALTSDIQAALSGASSPSSSNVFATANGLAGKANTSHTHAIADVTDLTTTLAGKASTTHTHTIANVTGLQTEIDNLTTGKANMSHTHAIADVSGLSAELSGIQGNITTMLGTAPTTDEKDALGASYNPTASNPFVTLNYLTTIDRTVQANGSGYTNGGFNTTHYPYEIVVSISGIQYAIPARII